MVMAYKITLLIIDHDEVGEDGIKEHIESVRYPNHCINPRVQSSEGVDLGEWDDDHPLNQLDTAEEEFARLFPQGRKP